MATEITTDPPTWTSEHFPPQVILDQLRPYIDSTVKGAVAAELDQRLQVVGLTEEISGLASLLAGRSNDGKGEVFRKALMLYGLALDALEKGHKLAIIDQEDTIVHDLIGFDRSSLAVQATQD